MNKQITVDEAREILGGEISTQLSNEQIKGDLECLRVIAKETIESVMKSGIEPDKRDSIE